MKLCPQCNNEFDDAQAHCPFDGSLLRGRTAMQGSGLGATTGGMLGGAPLSATAAVRSTASSAVLSAAKGAALSARGGAALSSSNTTAGGTLKPVSARVPRSAPAPTPPRANDMFATVRNDGYSSEGAPTQANPAMDPDAFDAPAPEPTTAIAAPESDAGMTMRVPPMVQLGPRTNPGVAPAYRPPSRFEPAPPRAQSPMSDAYTPSEPADSFGTDPSVPMPADERTRVQQAVGAAVSAGDVGATTSPSQAIENDAFTDSPTVAIKTVGDLYDQPESIPPEAGGSSEPDLTQQLIAGRYRATRLLGEGGMGVVYAAVDERLEKPVAIKVLKEEYARRADVVARFTQEAKSAAKIKHENVLQVTDHGKSAEGQHYIAMELLTGTDLADVLQRDGTVAIDRGLDLAVQICRALSAAHEQGVVHRDLKPENVFLIQDSAGREVVKIVDFGIAQLKDSTGDGGKKLTRTGMIFGTPEYMSPEQASGKPIDHRVDIYAVGVILYEMFTGRVPFVGDTFMGVLTQHMFEQPPPMVQINPSVAVSPDLESVIFKALAKDPGQRYPTMLALADDLGRVRSGGLSLAPRHTAAAPMPSAVSPSANMSGPSPVVPSYTGEVTLAEGAAPRRRRLGLVLALAVSAAAGLAVAYSLSASNPDPNPARPPVAAPPATPTPPVRPTVPGPGPAAVVPGPTPATRPAVVPPEQPTAPAAPTVPATQVSVRFVAVGDVEARIEVRPAEGENAAPLFACPALPCTHAVTPGVALRVGITAGRRHAVVVVTPAREGQDIALDPGPEARPRTPSPSGTRPRRQATPRCGQRYPNSDLLVPCI